MTTQEKITALEKQKQQVTDVFYAQQQIVDSLNKLLLDRQAGTEGTVYVQSVPAAKSTNYLLYGIIGLVAFFLFMR